LLEERDIAAIRRVELALARGGVIEEEVCAATASEVPWNDQTPGLPPPGVLLEERDIAAIRRVELALCG
jgi:hypothetical protein